MGDNKQLYIFDIDSALDRLENEENENQETFPIINTETQSQIQNNEITKQQQEHNQDSVLQQESEKEENGNVSTSTIIYEDLSIDNKELSESTLLSSKNESKVNDETSTAKYQINDEMESRSFNLLENYQSISMDDKITATSSIILTSSSATDTTSSSSNSNDIQSEDDEIRKSDQIPLNVSQFDTDDSSKRLISEESSNRHECEFDNDDEDGPDQPVTSDLTLTKTVEPTEYDPEPEELELDKPELEVKEIKENEEVNVVHEPVVQEKIVEEPIDIKEMSHNFESTMDDISDAELESLEQELDDLLAASLIDGSLEKIQEEEVVVKLAESVEKTLEIQEKKSPDVVEEVDNKQAEKPTEIIEVQEDSKEVEIETKENIKETDDGAKVIETDEIIQPTNDPQEPIEIEHQDSEISEAQEAVEKAPKVEIVDPDPVLSTSSTDESASIQCLPSQSNEDFSVNESNSTGSLTSQPDLGKVPPYWIPDNMTNQCMQCDQKFSLIKRRHHCRACGLLLCSACCNEKFFLHYLQSEGRICSPCHEILLKAQQNQQSQPKHPNPANPSEYCSTLPVQQQIDASSPPLTVMVPRSGVLKRPTGNPRSSAERKSVMFSDGIRPGTDLDEEFGTSASRSSYEKPKFNLPSINEKNNSYIPEPANELPPILIKESEYKYVDNNLLLLQRLRQEELKFAITKNFYVTVKIVTLICCTNKTVINFSTSGLLAVRQDEIMILLELNDDMKCLPKEVFLHLNEIYSKADKSNVIIKEYGYSQAISNNFLGAFGGFLYIRPTFQCLQSLTLPESPYLIGLLVHKWEVPWMRLFPLRLILRLGALYRYYPTPILSNINREPVFAEIVDFRNFSYTIEITKGLNIHMEEKKTSVFIPRNRFDQIMKVLNNSTDHLLAFGADFSRQADGHLVCIQNIDAGSSESLSYSTQAINIQGQSRIRTGASFLILNGALKQSSGLKGKCSIVEDGLMIQIFSTKMQSIRDALKNMKNIEIPCGPIDDDQKEVEEIVSIEWVDDDLSFNLGVTSPIDDLSFEGKESIRTRLDITSQSHTKVLRWCEVFLLESDDAPVTDDHLNYSKLSEPIAKACGNALLPFLDLMAVNQLRRIGIRVTLGENIKYLAGSNKLLFSPIYMNALDNELISVIHRQASNLSRDSNITMELIFYILNK
ncbi:zinc finger FYVE domain-containing protein 9 isoform X2 [Chironomus tepperi]|uniref:zinc finger FYVE domain-containing protein 9 isoform X2 n=1 Tax=Chironomus tepperi TaxID=113505 RepID=UPI00391F5237